MAASNNLGFVGKIQYYIDSFFASLNISAKDVITYVTCFGAGFAAGLLFRRYGKWIIVILLSCVALIALLQYFEIISVHQAQIRCLLGMQEVRTIQDLLDFLQNRLMFFLVDTMIMVVGFIVGFKLG
jgi:hypothetical protein